MIVTLDGRRLEGAWSAEDSLQGLVDHVRRTHLNGRVVVDVAIDGQALLSDVLDARLREPLGAAGQVDLGSADPQVLVDQALRDVAARLDGAGPRHEAIATALQSGRVVEAVNAYVALVGVWQDCRRVVEECRGLIPQDLAAVEVNGRSMEAHVGVLAQRLREVRDAIEARDFVLLADLLQYEMPEVCATWAALLRGLADTTSTPLARLS